MQVTGREGSILAVMADPFTTEERRQELLEKLGVEAAEVGRGILGLETTSRGEAIAKRYLARCRRWS